MLACLIGALIWLPELELGIVKGGRLFQLFFAYKPVNFIGTTLYIGCDLFLNDLIYMLFYSGFDLSNPFWR